MLRRIGRPHDRGEGGLSYIAVILLVATVTAAVTVVAVPDSVIANIKSGLCHVARDDCGPGPPTADGTPTPDPGGTATPQPGGTPTPSPGVQPVDQDLRSAIDALATAEQELENAQSEWDAFSLLNELKDLGLDFLIGDIQRCIEDPNISDCLWALVSVVPWSKIGKLVKAIPKLVRLIDRFIGLRNTLDRARDARNAARTRFDDLIRTRVDDALARACTQNSFVAGTGVVMGDGTVRAIERLKPGDRVLAGDPATGRTRVETVTAAFGGSNYESLVRVTIDLDGDRGDRTGVLTATEHHRFWEATTSRWARADELTGASTLRVPSGKRLRVLRAEHVPGHPRVYDITVANLHTFSLGALRKAGLEPPPDVPSDGRSAEFRAGGLRLRLEFDQGLLTALAISSAGI